jgi:hypothetical protein
VVTARIVVALLTAVIVLASALPAEASGRRRPVHTRVFIGAGPVLWWGPHPYWWYPPPYYTYVPPRVIVQEPPVYIQQSPAEPPAESYWHYCESAGGYYPNVQSCPEAWIKVPPRAP